jgi:hypothetical protein
MNDEARNHEREDSHFIFEHIQLTNFALYLYVLKKSRHSSVLLLMLTRGMSMSFRIILKMFRNITSYSIKKNCMEYNHAIPLIQVVTQWRIPTNNVVNYTNIWL